MVITEPLARRFISTYSDFLGSLLPDSAKAGCKLMCARIRNRIQKC